MKQSIIPVPYEESTIVQHHGPLAVLFVIEEASLVNVIVEIGQFVIIKIRVILFLPLQSRVTP